MTSRLPDLYAILGVAPDASPDEISHAYRSLLRRHHPDTRAGDEPAAASDSALQDVFSAYAVLRDPARRAAYDSEHDNEPATASSRDAEHDVAARSAADGPVPVRARHPLAPQPPIVAGPVRWHSRSGRT
jgi:DnaJ-class molecular chaperone